MPPMLEDVTYFNEWEPYPAEWLRNLFPGTTVDETDIRILSPDRVRRRKRCHFFAGIGGWEYALKLAGWPENRPVWTGSCPCQPFSVAGKGKGVDDERHLWPDFFNLIRVVKPPTIFGEQVADGGGLEWFTGVRADMESADYAVGVATLPACTVGAPHRRNRLFWVANSTRTTRVGSVVWNDQGEYGGVSVSRLADADGIRQSTTIPITGIRPTPTRNPFPQDITFTWDISETLRCRDSQLRRTEPGIFPLADGVSSRASKLRAYGNSIVPQVAAVFIRAFMECS